MCTAEMWCTPVGELGDIIATHQIANGAKEKPRTTKYKNAIPNIP